MGSLLGFLTLWWLTAGTVVAKECTNIPGQSSHTLRALASRKNVSDATEFAEGNKMLVPFPWEKSSGNVQPHSTPLTGGLGSLVNDTLREVPLHHVRLDPESDEGRAQETNLRYLLMLDVDRLVWSFRENAGLPAPGSAYGGWETPGTELRGHFVGHYLSATALMWASTHNDSIREKMSLVVDALAECQEKLGTGYLSAFPSSYFDRFEAIEPVWAPYYTIHKIMAGLLDQYTLAGNQKAWIMVLSMAKYFLSRVESVIERFTIERHWNSLNEEVGGMNDVMYRLYLLTEDPEHLKLAHLFDKPCFLGLLALKTDGLSGFHSNTHIPLVVGAQMRYESTGDNLYKEIAEYFMDLINTSHRFPTGGTSAGEFWSDPNRLGDSLTTEAQESCTTYNILKVARNLYRWTRDVRYADYYERGLLNGILGIQRGEEPGVMIYMLPEKPGTSKALSYHGWGTPFDSMWCCYGTGIESFSKLGDSIYFENDDAELYVMRFSSSSVLWTALGMLVTQKVQPLSSESPVLSVTFVFKEIDEGVSGKGSSLSLRIPSWAARRSLHVKLNGLSHFHPAGPGGYLTFSRMWKAGDTLEIEVPLSLAMEKIQDDREKFSGLHAFLYGPYVLAGMTDGDNFLGEVNGTSLSTWLVPVPASYNEQVYSFSQLLEHSFESVSKERTTKSSFVLSEGAGSIEMRSEPKEGTSEAAYSTFRLVPTSQTTASVQPIRKSVSSPRDVDLRRALQEDGTHSGQYTGSNYPILFGLVSLEPYSKPGKRLAHSGPNSKLVIVEEAESSKMENSVREFRLVSGLSGDENTVSFEAASHPGCFITSGLDPSITLRCKQKDDSAYDLRASFSVKKGLSSYHRMSFWAQGEKNHFLLFPIYAYKDEKYTIYFNLTSNF
ncbi:hypothetical protein R1flu_016558 [Riccia fluitans]|uniref:Alpha-L-arabinofuranosidase B arabinose-binding domain-containing protein n=1 Tax=Riccia fluitans TaxID=41844 RepID=A0ABD1YQ92_9MARC